VVLEDYEIVAVTGVERWDGYVGQQWAMNGALSLYILYTCLYIHIHIYICLFVFLLLVYFICGSYVWKLTFNIIS
jgi:hypothetical protein